MKFLAVVHHYKMHTQNESAIFYFLIGCHGNWKNAIFVPMTTVIQSEKSLFIDRENRPTKLQVKQLLLIDMNSYKGSFPHWLRA